MAAAARGRTLTAMATHVYLHDGRTLIVDAPMRQLEDELREPGSHVVNCVGVTQSNVTYGPSAVLVTTADVRLLVDAERRRALAGWDIIDSDDGPDDD